MPKPTAVIRHQILIVDDEPNMRKVLGAMLRGAGYDVLAATDGVDALEILGAHHVDTVITALKMPRMDGMELLKRLADEFPTLPVIIITAHGTVESAVTALKPGESRALGAGEVRPVGRHAL